MLYCVEGTLCGNGNHVWCDVTEVVGIRWPGMPRISCLLGKHVLPISGRGILRILTKIEPLISMEII